MYRQEGSTEYITAYANDTFVGEGTYSVDITGLTPSTKYYYKAVMDVKDPESGDYVTIEGEELTFTTDAEGTTADLGYIACFEVPEVSLSGTGTNGYYSAKDDQWYRYNTTNSTRAIATHTFKASNGKYVRNYTVMLDGDKKAPVWTAHVMHTSLWADNNVGRKESWGYDPAFDEDWQQSGISGSYSKGHLVASNYRQTTVNQNKQTFYYSNQAPQWQNHFNDAIWNNLENKVKSAAPSGRDTLYVVSGTLFEGTAKNVSGVQIPSHFYKCVMMCTFDASGNITAAKGCAYIFKNEYIDDTDPDETDSSKNPVYRTTIDAIEARAGFDFFPRVPAALQTAAENSTASIW